MCGGLLWLKRFAWLFVARVWCLKNIELVVKRRNGLLSATAEDAANFRVSVDQGLRTRTTLNFWKLFLNMQDFDGFKSSKLSSLQDAKGDELLLELFKF